MAGRRDFEAIARRLGADLVAFDRLTGGTSADVWRLDIADDDGPRSVVYRRHEPGDLKDHGGGVAHKEFHLLERLHERSFPVPRPLLVDTDEQVLVTEFVAGEPAVAPAKLTGALDQMVELLARLHDFDVAALDRYVVPALEDPLEHLPGALPASEAGRRLGAALARGAVGLPAARPALVHGDFWPGNLLWHRGRIAALIDWEDACVGDPHADLACARVELLCEYGDAASEYFTSAYTERVDGVDVQVLRIWDAYAAATALASMHLWGLEATIEADRRAATNEFLEQAVEDLLV